MARGFKVADAYVELTVDKDDLRKAVRDLPRDAGGDLDRSGKSMGQRLGKSMGDESGRQGQGVGDKLSMGIRMSVIRNSPLIAAAVAGGLTAGAPLLLAAAATMFAGIGAVAATQSLAVRSAWMDTWKGIKRGAFEDSGAIERVLVGMAGKVSDGFERMRPALRDAFDAAAPQLDRFTDSLIRAGENALPGLVRAVQAGSPVMEGFGRFMESIGSGLGDMFDVMAQNSEAAGTTFAALGEIIGRLLPILGSLMGTGAELGSVILPPLAAVLGVVAEALESLGPVLPAVVAGFAAMKIAQSAAGWVGSLSGKFDSLKAAMSPRNLGFGALGVVVAGIAADFANTKTEVDRWSNALLEGGSAAAAVRQEYEGSDYLLRSLDEWTGLAGSIEDAEVEMRDMLAAMTPTERAAALLTQAENDLAFALEEHGAGSDEVAAAQSRYDAALAKSERVNGDLEMAIDGVTAAMVEQANQALAAIDSGFAYRNSVDQLEDAQAALNDALGEFGPNSEEASRAQLALEEQGYRTALAYGQQQADLSGLAKDSQGYARLVQEEMLGELQRLHDAAGPEMKAAYAQQIAALEASGIQMTSAAGITSELTANIGDLSGSISSVPGQKFVKIDAPTAEQKARIEDLGYKVVTLPNGDIYVAATTADAEAAMNYVARGRGSTVSSYGNISHGESVLNWSARHRQSLISAGADVYNAERHLNWVARNRTVTIWTNTITDRKAGGPVINAATGRKVVGPGGPFDDLVPAEGPGGAQYRLSNGEWIIGNAAVSALERAFGSAIMPMINAGQLPLQPAARGFANGGSPGGVVATMSPPAPTAAGGNTINVNLNMNGVDFSRPGDRQRVVAQVVEGIKAYERGLS